MKPHILVIERKLVQPPRNDPNEEVEPEIHFAAFGLFEHDHQYVLPPGDYATLHATEFDKLGFPRAYELRRKRPRITVEQAPPPERTIEALTHAKESQ